MAVNVSKETAARLAALEHERHRLADELDAAWKQNSALSSRVSDLERQLAHRDRGIASLRSDTGDLERQLAAAKQRTAVLEAQLAATGGAAGDKDKLAAELAAAKQRIADLENQLDQSKGSLAKAEKDLLKALDLKFPRERFR